MYCRNFKPGLKTLNLQKEKQKIYKKKTLIFLKSRITF